MKFLYWFTITLLLAASFIMIAIMGIDLYIKCSSRFNCATVNGNSMSPALDDGSRLIIDSKYSYSDLKAGDIISAEITQEQLNDDVLWLAYWLNGQVHNGTIHIVKRIDHITDTGEIYLLGDNADESVDSRKFGTIDASSYKGKVIFSL